MRVAYFSPLPPDRSGIADYSALLLSALERHVDVVVVRPGRTRPVDADVALYHVGNDPDAHGWIVDALRRRPGVVVLHDFVLHHLVAGLTIGRKDGHAYLAAMERDSGVPGRLLGYGVLEGRVPPLWEVRPDEFPLAGEVLDLATGLVVHSRYVEARAREAGYDGPLWRIPHPAWPVPAVEPAQVDGEPLIGCFGRLNESKRIPQLLEAFARLRRSHPGARLLLVGPESQGFDLAGRIERLGLPQEGVTRERYVEEARLWALMDACDVLVALRSPTMGETSGSVVRALSLGKPLVVSDLGWFAELPDDVALKVPVGGNEEVDALAAALERLASDGELRVRMGAAARAEAREGHDLERVAARYAGALEDAAGRPAVERKVVDAVASAAADVGLDPRATGLAERLAEAGFGGPNGHVPVPGTGTRPEWTRRLSVLPTWLWLTGIVVVSAVVQFLLARRVVAPWIMVDELIYSDMARSFAASGHMLIRGAHANYGFVYPALISPAYALFGTVEHAYTAAKAINSVAISLAAVPAYFVARRVLRAPAALAAAVLAVALPSTAYAGTLMTENVFYPIFLCLVLALLAALERPTLVRQLVVLALCLLAFETRAQAVALVAAVLTAPLALAWIERGRPRRLKAWAPLYGVTAVAIVVVVVVEVARGRSPLAALGNYSVTGHANYQAWPSFRWLVYHVAELDLYLWILPFAALIVLVASARHLDRPLRVFAAAAAVLSVWLTIEVAVFASRYSLRVEERNLFYLAPLFLIALLAWIERGQPRPPRATVIAAVLAAALPGALPFAKLIAVNSQADTLGLQPWWYVRNVLAGHDDVGLAVVLTALVLGASFLWLPRRWAPALPALVAVGFLCTWLPLQLWEHSFRAISIGVYFQGLKNQQRDWIDRTVGRDANVAAVWTDRGNPFTIWQNEFWNRSLRRVYDLGSPLPGSMPETRVAVERSTGILADEQGKPIGARYVLTDTSLTLVGTPIARDPSRQMVLYRLTGPARTVTRVIGLYPNDTWSGASVRWIRAQCRGGTLLVQLQTDTGLFPRGETVVATGATTQTIRLDPGHQIRNLRVPLAVRGGACEAGFSSPTVVPAQVGKNPNDTRRLGVHFNSFRFLPAR